MTPHNIIYVCPHTSVRIVSNSTVVSLLLFAWKPHRQHRHCHQQCHTDVPSVAFPALANHSCALGSARRIPATAYGQQLASIFLCGANSLWTSLAVLWSWPALFPASYAAMIWLSPTWNRSAKSAQLLQRPNDACDTSYRLCDHDSPSTRIGSR